MSVVCVRLAYRKLMTQATDFNQVYIDAEGTTFLDESDIHARNRILPLADGYKLLDKPQEAKTYVIVDTPWDTPWAEQNNRYAVAALVSCIFLSPIGNPVNIPGDMPLAKYIRECWENENGEPFYFMD